MEASVVRDGESASTVLDGNCSPSFLHKPRRDLVLASPSIRQEALTFPAIAVKNATLVAHELNLSMSHGASGNKSKRTKINVWHVFRHNASLLFCMT